MLHLLKKISFSIVWGMLLAGAVYSYFYNIPKFFLYLLIAAGILFVLNIVLFNNIKNRVNRYFSLVALFSAVWVLAISFYDHSATVSAAVLWSRIAQAAASLIPVFILFFVFALVKKRDLARLNKVLLFTIALMFTGLSFSDLMVSGVDFVNNRPHLNLGYAFTFYIVCFILSIAAALYLLGSTYTSSKGVQKIQIGYLFLAFFIGSVFPIFTNLIFPLFGINQLAVFGPVFTLVTIGIIAYAIVRHKLMAVELIIQRGFIYTAASIVTFALYALLILVSEIIFRQMFGYTSVLMTALVIFVIAATYQPLIRYFQDLTDRILLRKKYDYQKIIRSLSREILTKLKLEELVQLIITAFLQIMRVSQICFIVMDKKENCYKPLLLNYLENKEYCRNLRIDPKSSLLNYLGEKKNILLVDDLQDEISRLDGGRAQDQPRLDLLKEVRNEIRFMSFKLWIPVILRDQVIAIIALGEKLSGDIFNNEDLRLLNTIANQTALALENIRLYREVLDMKNYSQNILDSLVYGVMTTDQNGVIKTFNPTMERLTRLDAGRVFGISYQKVFSPQNPIYRSIEDALSKDLTRDFEASLVNKNKELVPVMINTTILSDAQRRNYGVILALRDLSEIKKLESKARQAEKLKALGTMSAGMAHELKNPLSSLRIMTQLLPKKYDDPEFRRHVLEIFPREVERIDRIVEGLLQFTRTTRLKFSRVTINQFIDGILENYLEQLSGSKIILKKVYNDLPPVLVDKNHLSQVFSNLILNAIQAMPEGGDLLIYTRPAQGSNGGINWVVIGIKDSGHGIPSEYLPHLFDPFFTTKYSGSGLGLTVAHTIVDSHKGEIKVESRVGGGTLFEVHLPVGQ